LKNIKDWNGGLTAVDQPFHSPIVTTGSEQGLISRTIRFWNVLAVLLCVKPEAKDISNLFF
jgi:hypothetical protein